MGPKAGPISIGAKQKGVPKYKLYIEIEHENPKPSQAKKTTLKPAPNWFVTPFSLSPFLLRVCAMMGISFYFRVVCAAPVSTEIRWRQGAIKLFGAALLFYALSPRYSSIPSDTRSRGRVNSTQTDSLVLYNLFD